MGNSLPLVSIAIPTYNRANGYLREALQASLGQSYPAIEIIVSDNFSSDNTEEVVKSYSDSRIRYFRQSENIGANNNFNFCLEQARGAYFLLLPDDDLIDYDFIDLCMKTANYNTDIGIIRTGTRRINSKGECIDETTNRVVGLSTLEFFLGWFDNKTSPYMCSTLFNSRRLREIGGFKSKHNLFQDVIAEVKLAAQFGRVDIHDIKASFRKHSEEMTFTVKVGEWCEDSLELLDVMCDLVPEKRDLIRAKGMPFMANLNYNRASAVRSAGRGVLAFFIVFSKFRFLYLPSRRHLRHLIRHAI